MYTQGLKLPSKQYIELLFFTKLSNTMITSQKTEHENNLG